MTKSIDFKRVIPHILAVVLFALISVFFFMPQYEGRDIQQFDTLQANGMKASIYSNIEKYGEHPQWVANMFGGMPAYAIHMDYQGKIIPKIFDAFYFLGTPAAYYFMLMLGFYFMLLCFKVDPWLAMAGSIAYGFSSYFLIIYGAGHIMKIVALCYVAPMIGALNIAYNGRKLLGASLFGLFATMEINSVHPQIFYYFIIVMMIMILVYGVDAIKTKKLKEFFKRTALVGIFSLMAIGANSYYLYYTYDYSKDSTRGKSILTSDDKVSSNGLDKDYITAWSYGKLESFNMMIPNLYGGSSQGGVEEGGAVDKILRNQYNVPNAERKALLSQLPSYFGPQPMTSGPVYIGVIMMFLFIFSLFIVKGEDKKWILIASALALMLAWGKYFMPLTDLFINYFPLYNKFRTVSMILVVLELTIPLLAMLGLNRVIKGEISEKVLLKALKNTIIITFSLTLFFLLFRDMLFSFIGDSDSYLGLPENILVALSEDRASLYTSDIYRMALFLVLTSALLWFFIKKKVSKKIFIGILVIFVIADMIPVGLRYLGHDKFVSKKEVNVIHKRAVDKLILQDTTLNYRVADLSVSTFSDARASAFHRSIGGYFAAKPRRYQDLIDGYLSKGNPQVYDMLNTRYFIVPSDKGEQVQFNKNALGNAWFIENIEIVDTPDKEFSMLREIDPSYTAIVHSSFEKMLPAVYFPENTLDTIKLVDYRDNRMVYRSNTHSSKVAIFSEMWYPKGWKAYIDGVESDYFRANYVLEAMVIPEGSHEIVFEFKPPYYNIFKVMTISSSILILLSLLVAVFKKNKNK